MNTNESSDPADDATSVGPGTADAPDLATPVRSVRKRLDELLVLLLPAVILVPVVLTTPLTDHNDGFDSDGMKYAAMALRRPELYDLAHTEPWCWRVVTPLLASLLPFHIIGSFTIIAFVSDWIALSLLFCLMRRCGLSEIGSVLGVLLYAGIFWTVKFSFFSPCYVEHQTQMLLVLGLYLIVRRAYWTLPILLAVAVLQKESLLALAPIAIAHYWISQTRIDGRGWAWMIVLVAAPAVVLAIVRSQIASINPGWSRSAATYSLTEQIFDPTFWPRFFLSFYSGLGLLPLILIVRCRPALRYLRENPHWIVALLVGAAALFAGGDKSRLFLLAAPVVCLVAAQTLEPLLTSRNFASLSWVAIAILLHLYLGSLFSPMGSFYDFTDRFVPIHSKILHIAFERDTWVSLTFGAATLVLLRDSSQRREIAEAASSPQR